MSRSHRKGSNRQVPPQRQARELKHIDTLIVGLHEGRERSSKTHLTMMTTAMPTAITTARASCKEIRNMTFEVAFFNGSCCVCWIRHSTSKMTQVVTLSARPRDATFHLACHLNSHFRLRNIFIFVLPRMLRKCQPSAQFARKLGSQCGLDCRF